MTLTSRGKREREREGGVNLKTVHMFLSRGEIHLHVYSQTGDLRACCGIILIVSIKIIIIMISLAVIIIVNKAFYAFFFSLSPIFTFSVFLKALYLLVGETTNNKATCVFPLHSNASFIFPTLAWVFFLFFL